MLLQVVSVSNIPPTGRCQIQNWMLHLSFLQLLQSCPLLHSQKYKLFICATAGCHLKLATTCSFMFQNFFSVHDNPCWWDSAVILYVTLPAIHPVWPPKAHISDQAILQSPATGISCATHYPQLHSNISKFAFPLLRLLDIPRYRNIYCICNSLQYGIPQPTSTWK